jgi:hypothetical protein
MGRTDGYGEDHVSDRLRAPARRELPVGWIERHRDYLVHEVGRQPAAGLRRRRRLVIALIPAIVILGAATAFTTYSLTRQAKHLESVGCFDRADLAANTAVVDADGRSPIAICRDVWQQGALGTPVPKRFAACVLSTGAVGVFPSAGAGTCSALGLAPLAASYAAQAKRFGRLRDAIVARLGPPASGSSRGGPQCVGKDTAFAFVRRELDSLGFADWQVKLAGADFSPARRCADASFDTATRTVYLLPVAR